MQKYNDSIQITGLGIGITVLPENLVVWRLKHEPPNLIPPIFCHDVIDVGVWERSRTSSSN